MNPERPEHPETPEDTPVPAPERAEVDRRAAGAGAGTAAESAGAAGSGTTLSDTTDAGVSAGPTDAGAAARPEAAATRAEAKPGTADAAGGPAEAKGAVASAPPRAADARATAESADTAKADATDADADPEAAATGAAGADAEPGVAASAESKAAANQDTAGTGAAAEPEATDAGAGAAAEPGSAGAGADVEADAKPEAAGAAAEPEAALKGVAARPAQVPEPESARGAEIPHPGESTHPAAPHSDERRPRTALVVASVAAAVLALGGGGAWLASGLGGDSEPGSAGAGGTPPPLVLDGWSAGATESPAGIAPGEANPYGVRYVAEGKLPEGPGSAAVHVPEGAVGKDAVVRLARALEVDGAPVADGDGWRVGGHAGEPVLRVAGGATGGWSFSRYTPGTDNCPKADVCAQDPVAPAADAVSVAKARQVVAPVLKALGQDDAKTDASQVMGARRVVNAEPVVGGLPTYGWTTGLTVDERGEIVGGHGMLAVPDKGAEYPVLSADKTLALLNSAQPEGHRMGIGGCATPEPLKDRLEQPCGADASPGAPKGDRLTVEKAVFGLAAHAVDGREALVPSWLYQVRGAAARGTFTVTYPAVDPKYLAAPSPRPSLSSSSVSGARSVKVGAYSAHGRELTVRFLGGVCAEHRAAVRESAGRVTVSVTEHPRPGKVCVLMAKEFAETVRLDAPLAGRTVVAEDGGRVPEAESLGGPAK
ncbi:hypothetical protein [Streptomyces sp. LaPpAH-108]|uniref:hypothetical protein n=1 Tax=Streptomyces sp. LaPpAH-108 TaxID=1155714 RepID=UPI00039F4C6A|nr:hypothetical protein [Streptomyces sp. LaPpAH-108]